MSGKPVITIRTDYSPMGTVIGRHIYLGSYRIISEPRDYALDTLEEIAYRLARATGGEVWLEEVRF